MIPRDVKSNYVYHLFGENHVCYYVIMIFAPVLNKLNCDSKFPKKLVSFTSIKTF